MTSGKEPSVVTIPSRGYERELEQLYARRSAIDAIIESLEAYVQFLRETSDAIPTVIRH
jgi:hypothetical protein